MAKKTAKKAVQEQKLFRSKKDRILGGVCGGIAEQFNVDPLWVRLIAVLLALMNGIGIIIYLVAWVLIPEEEGKAAPKKREDGLVILGSVFILLGVFFLLKQFIKFSYVWPLAFIALGVYFLTRKKE